VKLPAMMLVSMRTSTNESTHRKSRVVLSFQSGGDRPSTIKRWFTMQLRKDVNSSKNENKLGRVIPAQTTVMMSLCPKRGAEKLVEMSVFF